MKAQLFDVSLEFSLIQSVNHLFHVSEMDLFIAVGVNQDIISIYAGKKVQKFVQLYVNKRLKSGWADFKSKGQNFPLKGFLTSGKGYKIFKVIGKCYMAVQARSTNVGKSIYLIINGKARLLSGGNLRLPI